MKEMENDIRGTLIFDAEKKTFELQFHRYYLSDQIERVRISGSTREIELESNRPWMKRNNKKGQALWKVISKYRLEMFHHPEFFAALSACLNWNLDKIDFPRPEYAHPKNAGIPAIKKLL